MGEVEKMAFEGSPLFSIRKPAGRAKLISTRRNSDEEEPSQAFPEPFGHSERMRVERDMKRLEKPNQKPR